MSTALISASIQKNEARAARGGRKVAAAGAPPVTSPTLNFSARKWGGLGLTRRSYVRRRGTLAAGSAKSNKVASVSDSDHFEKAEGPLKRKFK